MEQKAFGHLVGRQVSSQVSKAQEALPFQEETDTKKQKKKTKKQKKKEKEEQTQAEERRQRQIKQQERRAKLQEKHQRIRDKYDLPGGQPVITPCEPQPPKPEEVTGYLLKRGKVNVGFKKRWFQIVHGQLSYHKHSFDPPAGVIALSQVQGVRLMTQQRPPELHLNTPGRVFVLRSETDSPQDLETWAATIEAAKKTL